MPAPDDKTMADLARSLAQALCDFAHSRNDDDRKLVAQMQTELCAAYRAENETDVEVR